MQSSAQHGRRATFSLGTEIRRLSSPSAAGISLATNCIESADHWILLNRTGIKYSRTRLHREPAKQLRRSVPTRRSCRACCRLTSDYRARRRHHCWTGRRGREGGNLALVSAEMPPPVENGLGDQVGIRGHGDVVGAVHVGVGHGLEPRADVLRVLQGHVASAGELQIRASRCQVSNATASVQR